jgi:hypothetical protein
MLHQLQRPQHKCADQRGGDGRREWNASATARCDLAFAPAELRGDAVRAAEEPKQNREGQRGAGAQLNRVILRVRLPPASASMHPIPDIPRNKNRGWP